MVAVSVAVVVPGVTAMVSWESPGLELEMMGLGGMAIWKLKVPWAASCQFVVEPPGR